MLEAVQVATKVSWEYGLQITFLCLLCSSAVSVWVQSGRAMVISRQYKRNCAVVCWSCPSQQTLSKPTHLLLHLHKYIYILTRTNNASNGINWLFLLLDLKQPPLFYRLSDDLYFLSFLSEGSSTPYLFPSFFSIFFGFLCFLISYCTIKSHELFASSYTQLAQKFLYSLPL